MNKTRELPVSTKKRREKMRMMVELRAEARLLAEAVSASQQRFFKSGIFLQREFEPAGPMAGFSV